MNIHLKIWIPGVISFIAYLAAKGLEMKPGPDVFTQPALWYFIWGALQLLAAYYAWILLKNYKHRSGTWITLVALFGLLGIIVIYLIPAKKLAPPTPTNQI